MFKTSGLLSALLALLVIVSADASAQSPAVAKVKLAILPIASVTPVYIAQKHGFFQQEGLAVETRAFQGGPEVTAAVINGDMDFGYTATISPLIAHGQGAPLRIIAVDSSASSAPGARVNAMLVRPESGINGFKDLEGKRVAVNALKGLLELLVRAGVDEAGGNSEKVTFVEVPFPQMGTVVSSGQVAAVVNVEPFITSMIDGGAKVVGDLVKVIEGAPLGVWVSTEKKAENKDLRLRFRRAIEKANIYALQHPEEVRALVPTFTRITPVIAGKMALPSWTDKLDVAGIQRQADLLLKYKFIRTKANANEIVTE